MSSDDSDRVWVWDTDHASGVHHMRRDAEEELGDRLAELGPGSSGVCRTVQVSMSGDARYLDLERRRMVCDERGVIEWARTAGR